MQPTPDDVASESGQAEVGFSAPRAAVAPQPQPAAPQAWPPPRPASEPQPGHGSPRPPLAPEPQPATPAFPRQPVVSGSPSRLGRSAPAIAAAALLLLAFTAFQTWSLSKRVADVDERLRTVTNDVLDLRGRVIPLEQRSGQWLDAVTIAKDAAPAVFTIVAGRAQGTGFGFYTDGKVTYIATNYHVVAAAAERHDRVAIYQGDKKWLGITDNWDRNSDVALIRVDEGLPVLLSAYGQGHDPVLGDPVLAFGSPEGLEGTATEGIISAIRQGWIQTDAQINPGNSGGPLLNSHGEVIGLTAIGIGGGGSGLGFAIDIREVCALAGDHTC